MAHRPGVPPAEEDKLLEVKLKIVEHIIASRDLNDGLA